MKCGWCPAKFEKTTAKESEPKDLCPDCLAVWRSEQDRARAAAAAKKRRWHRGRAV